MRDDQYYPQGTQLRRKGRRWIEWLWPLLFLLIFAFTQSLAGLIVSLSIVVVLEVVIATAPLSWRMGSTPPNQQTMPPPAAPVEETRAEMPYEQGYRGAWSGPLPSQPQRGIAALPPQPAPSLLQQMGPGEESDRLARLKLLGDLHHSGVLTDEEFEHQKRRILQADTPKEATGAEVLVETQDGEQPQLDYPQELPPMQR
jgi:Short C-terminal domain